MSLSVHPSGDVLACCGHVTRVKDNIFKLGNIKMDNLLELVRRLQRNVLYWWIFLRGPLDVLNVLDSKSGSRVYHKWEVCYLLSTRYKNKLKELSSQKERIFNAIISGEDVRSVLEGDDK